MLDIDPAGEVVSNSEDGPSFITQRRNLMVACLVVLAIWTLELQYNKIRLLDVTAGAPWNFDIGWACLMLYFMLRLYQSDPPGNILERPKWYFSTYIQKSLQLALYTTNLVPRVLSQTNTEIHVRDRVTNRGASPENVNAVSARFVQIVNAMPVAKYFNCEMLFEVELSDKSTRQTNIAVRVDYTDPIARRAWSRAYLTAAVQTLFFTEYWLPFILGFACISYCVYSHLILNW